MTAILPLTSHGSARRSRDVVALVLARAVNQLGGFAMAFLIVTLVEVYGASLATAGWVVGLFGLATIPSRLVGGWLADRFGRRRTIVGGLLACAVGLGVIAASTGVTGAAVGAVLLGLAFEIYEPPSQALLAELVPAERWTQAFGMLGAALAAAAVGAGVLAALVGGADLRLLFVADAATCLAAAALVVLLVREPAHEAHEVHEVHSGGTPWRDRRLLIMLAVGTGSALAWNLGSTMLPLTVAARGMDAARTGWILVAAAVVTISGQRLLRRATAGPFALMAWGLVAVACGFAVVAYATTLPLLAAGFAVVTLGEVFLLGPPYAVVAGLCNNCSRAGYLAVFGTGWGTAQTIGPPVWTRLFAHGIPVVWLAGAGLSLGLAALCPLVARAVAGRLT